MTVCLRTCLLCVRAADCDTATQTPPIFTLWMILWFILWVGLMVIAFILGEKKTRFKIIGAGQLAERFVPEANKEQK
jgi:hypothetical protein